MWQSQVVCDDAMMPTTNFEIVSACMLGCANISARLNRIALLADRYPRSERQDGCALRLTYETSASHELRTIVELECQCYPFLVLDLSEAAGHVQLASTTLPSGGESSAVLYEHFRGAIPSLPARSCSGGGCGCAA